MMKFYSLLAVESVLKRIMPFEPLEEERTDFNFYLKRSKLGVVRFESFKKSYIFESLTVYVFEVS